MLRPMKCPCDTGKDYKECCGRYHKGEIPKTPLDLMRSRYSAYALQLTDYVLNTERPCKEERRAHILHFTHHTTFLRLEILEHTKNTVTFKAHLSQDGKDTSFTEKSYFTEVHGKWFYIHK